MALGPSFMGLNFLPFLLFKKTSRYPKTELVSQSLRKNVRVLLSACTDGGVDELKWALHFRRSLQTLNSDQAITARHCLSQEQKKKQIYSKQMLDGYVQCFYREWPRITASMSSAVLCGQKLSVSALPSLVETSHMQLLRTGTVAEILFNSMFYSLSLKLPHVANSIAREFIINWPNSIFIFPAQWKLQDI